MMSRGNQCHVEELLNYGFSAKAIHKQTGLSLQQIYEIEDKMYERKAKQKKLVSEMRERER